MDWLSFFIGVLVGWLVELFIDWFYWRRKYAAFAQTEAELRAELANAQGALQLTRIELYDAQALQKPSSDHLNQQIVQFRSEMDLLNKDLAGSQAEITSLRSQLATAQADYEQRNARSRDDLAGAQAELALLRERLNVAAVANADLPSVDLDLPKLDADLDLPSVDFDLPKLDADLDLPSVDLDLPKLDADLDLPSVDLDLPKLDADLDLPSADLDLPKLDADLDLPSADFDLPKLDADLDLPSVDLDLPKLDADLDLPSADFDLPKLDADLDLPSADLDLPKLDADLDLPSVDLDLPKLDADLDLPSVDLDLPKLDADLDLPSADFDLPKLDADLDLPSADFDLPKLDADLDLPSADFDLPKLDADLDLPSADFDLPKLDADLDLPSADLDLPKLDADLDLPSADFDLPKLDADLDLPSVDVAASADDLTVISGIGPKIASILHNNGIRSFAQLAASDTATLRQILDAAGSRYKLADPTTWPEQARFAGNVGEFDAAVAPADEVIVEYFEIEAAAPTEEKVVVWEIVEDTTPDDLVAIVGIGPKIAGILNRNGIYSFAQLANSRVGDLQQMLDAAGPRYSLADPASWPQQAYDLLTSRHMAAATARADFNDATGYAEADSVKMVEVIEVVAEEESVIEAVFEEDFGEDDLTVISGIGPKVADVLKLNGLVNYRQLMRTDVDTLRSVLQQAGPRFTLIDPASWPVQAELAARNDWEGLNALHAQMGIQWL